MIEFYKKRGETPLQALERLRKEKPELESETLSYAGRLDPMAEGILPVLVGKIENQNRQEFLNKDKVYEVELLLGFQTDTGDVLGVVTQTQYKDILIDTVEKVCADLTGITEQTYPWYSSKTVEGIPLFMYAQKKNFEIIRPVRKVKIYSVKDIKHKILETNAVIKDIIQDVQSVTGDFRQSEIIESWQERPKGAPKEVHSISFKIKVSSGTYIRALTEHIQVQTGIPNTVLKLVRTQVL